MRGDPATAALPIIMLTAKADEIESRTVDVHIRRLRAKLGAEERRIATIKGVGYRFETD